LSIKWIRNTIKETIYKIQNELDKEKQEIKKKDDELSKIGNLNEALIKEAKELKKRKSAKGKWEKDKPREELKKNYGEYKTIIKYY